MATHKQIVQLGRRVLNAYRGSGLLPCNSSRNRFEYRHISQLVKSDGELAAKNALALVRILESQGIPSKQAVTTTSVIIKALNNGLENVAEEIKSLESQGVLSKQARALTSLEVSNNGLENVAEEEEDQVSLQKRELKTIENGIEKLHYELSRTRDDLSNQNAETTNLNNKLNQFSLVQHQTKKLQNEVKEMRSELRYKIDKLIDSQRLDLNLKISRLQNQLEIKNAEITYLTNKLDQVKKKNKLDKEIHASREAEAEAKVDAKRRDMAIGFVNTFISSSVGLAIVCL